MSSKKKKNRMFDELINQLMVQAERLGIQHRYTSLWFMDQEILGANEVLAELYAERSNLEYELNLLGSNKKDILIKLERLHGYVRKAESLRKNLMDKYDATLDKNLKITESCRQIGKLEKKDVKAVA